MSRPFSVTIAGEKVRLWINDRIDRYKDSWVCKLHANADFELHMILKGGCDLEVEGARYRLTAPEAVIIPPGQYHLPAPLPGEFERFTMSFSLEQGSLRSQLTGKPFRITPEAVRLCRDIFRESAGSRPFRGEMIQMLLTMLVLCIFRSLGITEAEPLKMRATDEERTQSIDDFFELHMADKVGAEELASMLHISRRQLARVLQMTYGMGFREKRIRTRMEHAAWQLRNTDAPVSRIAESVGYASETAFYQAFTQQYGLTPGQYRAESAQTKRIQR